MRLDCVECNLNKCFRTASPVLLSFLPKSPEIFQVPAGIETDGHAYSMSTFVDGFISKYAVRYALRAGEKVLNIDIINAFRQQLLYGDTLTYYAEINSS